jgi:hypothetical protein
MTPSRLLPLSLALSLAAAACAKDTPAGPPVDASLPQRTFRLGFSAIPPRATSNEATLAALDLWSRRADAAIMHVSVPYRALLSGTTAATYVSTVDLPLANYYRAHQLSIVITVDVTDGLNRAAEAPELVALGRSITEPAVQAVYRQYVTELVRAIRPEYLGLAAETNLIRATAPAPVYAALVTMANAAAVEVKAMSGTLPKLYISVQAEVAWGKLIPAAGFVGVEKDFQDFPFGQALGISSYPYFAYPDPDDVPLDYYFRLPGGRAIPLLVVEGGWTSASVGSVQSSLAKQARYLRRQEKLLDSAKVVASFQLTFTDLDIASFPPQPPGSVLPLFTHLGLVDVDLRPKLALATYDSILARGLRK